MRGAWELVKELVGLAVCLGGVLAIWVVVGAFILWLVGEIMWR